MWISTNDLRLLCYTINVMKYALFIAVILIGTVLGVRGIGAHGGETGEVSNRLVKTDPAPGENYHIEFKPQTPEGYRIPDMDISVTIKNTKTGASSVKHLHAMFGGNYHYGSNIALSEGEYIFSFHADPPMFMREGDRANSWIDPIDAEFTFSAVNDPKEGALVGEKMTKDMKIVFEMETAETMWEFPKKAASEQDMNAVPSGTSDKIFLAVFMLLIGVVVGFFVGKSKRPAQT